MWTPEQFHSILNCHCNCNIEEFNKTNIGFLQFLQLVILYHNFSLLISNIDKQKHNG